MTELDTISELALALNGNTRSFSDEIRLHTEIAAALDQAGIPYEREVIIPGAGRIDFIVSGCIAVEVKASGGGGMAPVRQLFRYLEDPRFSAGVILSVRRVDVPDSFERADGTHVPVRKIELWANAF